MPLEDILRAIKEKAEKSCAEVVGVAENQAAERLKAAEDEARELARRILAEAETQAKAQELLARSRAEGQARQAVLKAKQDLVNSVFDRAIAALKEMPPDDYAAVLLSAIVKNATGGEEVVLGPEDRDRLPASFASDVSRALEAAHKPDVSGFVFSEVPLGGGLMLRKGGIITNLTFPAVMKKVRDELEIEISSLLFR